MSRPTETYSVTRNNEDRTKDSLYPLESTMTLMNPTAKVAPSAKMTPERKACDRAFALACQYSGGQDLVEEMVAADYWPLGKWNPEFRMEYVKLPVFGPAEGLPFPRFGLELKEGESPRPSPLMLKRGRVR